MSDLISRQAAIEALGERPMVWMETDYEIASRNQYDMDKLAIETVPSAQPEQDKRIEQIADIVEGTIDHFDREDAMDLLYQIKEVING